LLAHQPVLKNLRKYSSSRGVKVLYALLAISFVGWGIGVTNSDRLDVVAQVHGERITRRELDDQTAMLQRRLQEMLRGGALPQGLQLRGQALDQLIDDALLRHEADRLGLEVSDDDVLNAIQKIPQLQQDGRFNRDLLERFIETTRDRGEFESQVRQDLVNRRLRGLVIDGVSVSDAEIEDRFRQDREQVNLSFVRIPAADLAKTVSVSDDEVAKWVADNPDRYRTAPRVRVRYAAYLPKDFAALARPSEDAIKAYYDAHRDDRFTAPEEIRARHILIKLDPNADEKTRATARKKAEDVLAKVKKKGSDFAKLAQQLSEDAGSAAKGGDLGLFSRGKMVPAFDDAAFALEPGAVSEVVETPFGFHVIKVDEKLPGGPKPLETVREEIVQTLADEQGLELARKQAEADRREVVRGKRLADVAGSRLKESAPFAATDEVAGVGRLKAFNDAAFALGPDQPSDLIEGDDVVYLLEPIERLEPQVPPVAELGGRPAEDAKRARGEAAARERGEQALARAKEIGLDKAAAEQKLTVEDTGPFERRAGVVPKLAGAAEMRTDAFALTAEQPLGPKVYTVGGDAVVVALKERIAADPAGLAEAKDSLKTTLLQQKQQDALQAFMNHLKESAQKDGALAVQADAVGEG
jgi:peptidyl-prolyl cis-trans isomerase D